MSPTHNSLNPNDRHFPNIKHIKHFAKCRIATFANREMVIEFLTRTFSSEQGVIASENFHTQLADFLEDRQVENDEDSEINTLTLTK